MIEDLLYVWSGDGRCHIRGPYHSANLSGNLPVLVPAERWEEFKGMALITGTNNNNFWGVHRKKWLILPTRTGSPKLPNFYTVGLNSDTCRVLLGEFWRD
ncbi:hypothetical protein Axy10_081 [Achromobacter phage vB_AxyP_19-32_Axy10]|uniref:Uncharacterized protein n=1 Tax=Achromobacter phage vB_AxyP_19-32_Axy10 TaxID=2591041 RepID=A0A514CU35_9CAUD|nr:hypothetical protein KMC59_gp37 [Achromobacter phage vB_AxyP_19-32_Axy10]QDH83970.1 hypothetical protein Axy10_081 [Achromobacter phage vB_AxyP_19-32_Axy10]